MELPAKAVIVMRQWCIVGDLQSSPQLGEMLARNVSGEWEEDIRGALVEYRLTQNDENRPIQLDPMARTLAEFVLATASQWLRALLLRRYQYLSSDEVVHIVDVACHQLFADREHNKNRLDLVTTVLIKFLHEHDTVVLEGVRGFLIPEVLQEFYDGIDRAIDDWLMEKEYREFIRLLRNFVSLNEPKINGVHVFWHRSKFVLEDDHGRPAGTDVMDELTTGVQEEDESPEDLLVSALITLAPRQIVFHCPGPIDNTWQTIHSVFDERVVRCPGCQRCGRHSLTDARNKV